MNKAFAVAVGILLLVLLILFSTTYTVRFHEVAVRTTFGKTSAASVQSEPGVHFRFPLFADRVEKYDTRVQLAETPLMEAPTADGQSVVVRAFLMWQIDPDPAEILKFSSSFPRAGDAEDDLRGQLQTAVKASLGGYTFDDLIGPQRKLAMAEQDIQRLLMSTTRDMGIKPVTVGISQIQLPAKTTRAVLARMQATRQKLAEAERNRGSSDAVGIHSEANTIIGKLRAFADQRAQEIKGQANRRAAQYLREMSEDEEFAIFLVWLDTLREGLKDTTTLIFSDQREPWHLLNQRHMSASDPIPQPRKGYFRQGDEEPAGARRSDDEEPPASPVGERGS